MIKDPKNIRSIFAAFDPKRRKEADKVIRELRLSVIKKLNDEELEEFRKTLAEAFDMSLNENQD